VDLVELMILKNRGKEKEIIWGNDGSVWHFSNGTKNIVV